jgi:predicted DNA-binding ribbon-helix-helix protein
MGNKMPHEYIRKNVTIQGHRTSMSLEKAIWSGLEEICEREDLTFNQICSLIDRSRKTMSRTSAVRTFIVNYYRHIAGKNNAGKDRKVDVELEAIADRSD